MHSGELRATQASRCVLLTRPMFDALAEAGVDRDGLVQAWDWHTASGDVIRSDLLTMRDDALTRLTDETMQCTVDSVVEPEEGRVARRVEGTFRVPLYMGPLIQYMRLYRWLPTFALQALFLEEVQASMVRWGELPALR